LDLVKTINQIIPRMLKEKIEIDFFEIKPFFTGTKNYHVFLNTVTEVMLHEAKENNLTYVSLGFSPLIFSQNISESSMKNIFQNNRLPIIPLSGVGTELYEDAKEIGLETQIPKISKIIKLDFKEIRKISEKDVKSALKTKKTVNVTVGPNNVHDILDSLEQNH
jgi:hypothetical protein